MSRQGAARSAILSDYGRTRCSENLEAMALRRVVLMHRLRRGKDLTSHSQYIQCASREKYNGETRARERESAA